MLRSKTLVFGALVLFLAACGGSAKVAEGAKTGGAKPPPVRAGKVAVDQAAQNSFEDALKLFVDTDKSGDWSSCEEVAKQFLSAAKRQKQATSQRFAEAIYNAGLSYQRCNRDADAQKLFSEAIEANPSFHRARAQLILFEYQRTGELDGTIQKLDQVIRDAKFQNAEALAYLAALQMERGGDLSDQDGADDYERARKNLQRALAIDDGFMPAFNQLAVYYLEQAKRKATKQAGVERRRRRGLVVSGTKGLEVNQQMLDLAALVASQAIRKNPNYAPIHNTAGLIQVELRNFNGAVQSFGAARRLDPKFFEAHMNYGAANLSFRGFAEAEKAYRAALNLKPKEYEARLGLALALRGQINDSNFDRYVAESQKQLDECKKIDSARAETYYNEAILTQEYKSKGGEKTAIPMLEKAATLYEEFISKAGGDATFEAAVKRAKDRTQDIRDTVKFIREGHAAKAQADAEMERAVKERKAAEAQKAAADKAAADKGDKAGADKGDKPGADKGDKPGADKAGAKNADKAADKAGAKNADKAADKAGAKNADKAADKAGAKDKGAKK
jgi:Tfp pilus assembly protein PilF